MNAQTAIRVVGIALVASIAASSAGAGDGTAGPPRFRFAAPGATTIDDALRELGRPALRTPVYVVEDEIDVFGPMVGGASGLQDTHRRAARRGVRVIQVELLEWPRDDPGRGLGVGSSAKLVFRGGRLWYAVTEPSATETRAAELDRLYPQPLQRLVLSRHAGDLGYHVKVFALPMLGIAYAQWRGERINTRVVFPPSASVRFRSDEDDDEGPSPPK